MSKRCSCFATSSSRICRKNFTFIIQGKKICHVHAKYKFNKYAILIQKFWVGYRARCIIKNVYILLSDELQKKIIFLVRENYLIKKHHYDVIWKILDSKFNKNAILIQKFWLGYRARCIIKNVYILLPDELQKKIIFLVRENYLIKKHHYDVICKILDSKVDNDWLLSVINSLKTSNVIYQSKNLDTVAHIYHLFTKYFTIAPHKKTVILGKSIFAFEYICNILPFKIKYNKYIQNKRFHI